MTENSHACGPLARSHPAREMAESFGARFEEWDSFGRTFDIVVSAQT
ncbi:hypothetical protein ACLQ3C_01810 [Gordonia sp. DT30]